MNFISTRNASPAATLSQAIAAGLAPDGGLYVPEAMPGARELAPGATLADTAATLRSIARDTLQGSTKEDFACATY